MRRPLLLLALLAGFFLCGIFAGYLFFQKQRLTEAELEIARTLSLSNLRPLRETASNSVANDPEAAAFGALLFNDTRLSSTGEVACASCHLPEQHFQDNLPLGQGLGTTNRRTMPLRGVGYAHWFFWDGRKDSLWSQALAPLENPVEHGFTRSEVASLIARDYQEPYQRIFGTLPLVEPTPPASPVGNAAAQAAWGALSPEQQRSINRVFANTGKAIAAFERTLHPLENRFDRYVSALLDGRVPSGNEALTPQEIEGFKIFAGKGQCTRCHNGPLYSDLFFHNTGVASRQTPLVDHGRADAIALIETDPFNCLGTFSDAEPSQCGELRFMSRDMHLLERAFKTPSLRGVSARAPYMHAGQLDNLPLVIEHYNRAVPAPSGHTELNPLGLSTSEKAALKAFLDSL